MNEQIEQDAARYRALRVWLVNNTDVWIQLSREDSEPFVMGDRFYGWTFDEAVDSLPEVKA